jgi:hypothetical protein
MRLVFLTALLLLPSCAYFIDKHIQDIEFVTISAEDAECDVFVNGLRNKVHPPQTININNNEEDMVIDCKAPGNRRKKITVPADINATTLLNVGNAGAGLPWDFASKAAFKYPDVIEIDFTGIPSTSQPLPAQNNPDIIQPEEYILEEFSPSQPVLNADRHEAPLEIVPRRLPSYDEEMTGAGAPNAMGPPKPDDKGVLMQVIKDLRNQVDPAAAPVDPQTPPVAEPGGKTLPGDGVDPLGTAPVQ